MDLARRAGRTCAHADTGKIERHHLGFGRDSRHGNVGRVGQAPGQEVIDAGSKALGREPLRGAGVPDDGFGSLLEHPEVTVKGMSEEHGILDLSRSSWRPSVGERGRVIPNHVCIVVHLNDVVAGVRGSSVETSWPVAARGRGYTASLGSVVA